LELISLIPGEPKKKTFIVQITIPPSLYEKDYSAWLDLTLAQLKNRDFGALA
jgi:hypothetical protein